MSAAFGLSDDSPVYVISVAAQLAGMHPQTLRYYDKLGLVSPSRTRGQGRRYSLRDVLALREVQRLSQEDGVNLSGIKRILELDQELRQHQQRLADVSAELALLRVELESTRSVAARLAGLLRGRTGGTQLVPVHKPGRGGCCGARRRRGRSAGHCPPRPGGGPRNRPGRTRANCPPRPANRRAPIRIIRNENHLTRRGSRKQPWTTSSPERAKGPCLTRSGGLPLTVTRTWSRCTCWPR